MLILTLLTACGLARALPNPDAGLHLWRATNVLARTAFGADAPAETPELVGDFGLALSFALKGAPGLEYSLASDSAQIRLLLRLMREPLQPQVRRRAEKAYLAFVAVALLVGRRDLVTSTLASLGVPPEDQELDELTKSLRTCGKALGPSAL